MHEDWFREKQLTLHRGIIRQNNRKIKRQYEYLEANHRTLSY